MASASNPMLGQYELLRRLGEGSFGSAWLARDTKTQQEVVIKRFNAETERDHILNGAANCKRVDKTLGVEPNLVQLLGHVVDPECKAGSLALVLEYCNSGNLERFIRDRLLSRKPLSAAEAIDIAMQLANGLLLMHSAQLFHRDLAPRNIFLHKPANAPTVFKIGAH
jgi:eukaryotic-like serine/threonine-protein kinase